MVAFMRMDRALQELYAAFAKVGWRRSTVLDAVFRHAYFAYKRHLEDPFHNLARASPEIFRGGHILDVGANIGYTASVFADVVSPGFGVYAFEPEAANFAALERFARQRHPGILHPVRAVVGECEGETELWINARHPGDHRVRTDRLAESASPGEFVRIDRVRQISIDGFLQSTHPPLAPIRFIKLDVQGFELPVCRGMQGLLASTQHPMSVAMEYDPQMMTMLGFAPTKALEALLDRRFELRVLERSGRTVQCAATEIESHIGARGYVDLLFLR